ncbi:MAG: hypothetical protein EBQ96_02300 [Proteobacteria bacterium]|nr:hypothetical protein [Pseudomonadota bacterium]
MKTTIFALALSVLLASASFGISAAQAEENTTFSNRTVVENIITQQEDEHLTGKSEKERKREMARLKKQYELEKRKERWSNINPNTKKKDEIKKKAIEAANSGGEFDVTKLSKPVREHIQKLTPEDKANDKREVLKTWTQLSPDQKAYIKKSGKEKWKTLTKEEQEQYKAILAYEKTANGTAFDAPPSTTEKPNYGVKIVGKAPMPNNYFGDLGPQGRSKKYKVQADKSLSQETFGSGYSYSMFGPGGARAAGSRSYDDQANGN